MKIEIPFIGCLLLVLAFEVYGPHPIGMSNNGDYPKTLGRVRIWPVDATQQRRWFITDYKIDPAQYWNPHYPTSEMLFVLGAKRLARLILPRGRFDLRVLGTLHLTVFLFGAWLLFRATRGLRTPARIAAGFILVFVLSDVEYSQYLNTPYMDAASIAFAPSLFGVMVNAARANRRSWQWAAAFAVAGTLFLTAKLQHQACVIGLALFAGIWASRYAEGWARAAWAGAGLLLVGVSVYMFTATPTNYRADAIFNVLVIDITPRYYNPVDVIADLGLSASDEKYLDAQSAFSVGSPMAEPNYREHLLKAIPTLSLARYYCKHPAITAGILQDDWLQYGPDIGDNELAQLRKVDDPTPFARAKVFNWWSLGRGRLMQRVPLYPLVLLLAALAWSIASLFRKHPNPYAPAMCAASTMSVLSFMVAALGDASDNSRHLLFFHVALDFCIVLAAIAGIARIEQAWLGRSQASARL